MTVPESLGRLDSRRRELSLRLDALAPPATGAAALELLHLQGLLRRCQGASPRVAERLLTRVASAIGPLANRSAVNEGTGRGAGGALATLACTREAVSQLRGALDREAPAATAPRTLADRLAAQDGWFGMPPRQSAGGLHAARHLADLQARYQLDRLMATALLAQPDAPGPLNPQSLLVRALKTLQEVSPAYLARFVDHARTLLWLQRAADRVDAARPARGKG